MDLLFFSVWIVFPMFFKMLSAHFEKIAHQQRDFKEKHTLDIWNYFLIKIRVVLKILGALVWREVQLYYTNFWSKLLVRTTVNFDFFGWNWWLFTRLLIVFRKQIRVSEDILKIYLPCQTLVPPAEQKCSPNETNQNIVNIALWKNL